MKLFLKALSVVMVNAFGYLCLGSQIIIISNLNTNTFPIEENIVIVLSLILMRFGYRLDI